MAVSAGVAVILVVVAPMVAGKETRMQITERDRERITQAVRAAESKTSGEIVTVLAQESDTYRFFPTLWAALLALIAP